MAGKAYFAPTRLASSLCGGGGMGGGGAAAAHADIAGGHIIVESNFKVRSVVPRLNADSILGHNSRQSAVQPPRMLALPGATAWIIWLIQEAHGSAN